MKVISTGPTGNLTLRKNAFSVQTTTCYCRETLGRRDDSKGEAMFAQLWGTRTLEKLPQWGSKKWGFAHVQG